jgi:hypothetical protein
MLLLHGFLNGTNVKSRCKYFKSHNVTKHKWIIKCTNTDFTSSVAATNTAKVGITTQQASDITTNNAKVGITPSYSDNNNLQQ